MKQRRSSVGRLREGGPVCERMKLGVRACGVRAWAWGGREGGREHAWMDGDWVVETGQQQVCVRGREGAPCALWCAHARVCCLLRVYPVCRRDGVRLLYEGMRIMYAHVALEAVPNHEATRTGTVLQLHEIARPGPR